MADSPALSRCGCSSWSRSDPRSSRRVAAVFLRQPSSGFLCLSAIPSVLGPQDPPGPPRVFPALWCPAIAPRSPGPFLEEGLRDQAWALSWAVQASRPLGRGRRKIYAGVLTRAHTCVFLSVSCILMENHGFYSPWGAQPTLQGSLRPPLPLVLTSFSTVRSAGLLDRDLRVCLVLT